MKHAIFNYRSCDSTYYPARELFTTSMIMDQVKEDYLRNQNNHINDNDSNNNNDGIGNSANVNVDAFKTGDN